MSAYTEVLNKIKKASAQAKRLAPPSLIAVSKFQPIEKIISLYQEGHRDFGENYVQELIEKKKCLEEQGYCDLRFHFIGGLQTNKVKQLLPHVSTIHSVDSLRLLEEIDKRAKTLELKAAIYFQVNIDQEDSKGGFFVEELEQLSKKITSYLNVQSLGLMAIPAADRSPDFAFDKMRALSEQYGNSLGRELSMGMSQDFELAIQRGSTVVRVGSALFGARD